MGYYIDGNSVSLQSRGWPPSGARPSGLCGRVCGKLLPSSSNMAESGSAKSGSTRGRERVQNGGWCTRSRDGSFARVALSGILVASQSQDIVRIVSACCIRPSTAYLGVRASIMCNIRKCALLRRRRVVSCHQSTIHSQSVFEAPGVLSGRARRAPRAQNRPWGSVRPWPPGARRAR